MTTLVLAEGQVVTALALELEDDHAKRLVAEFFKVGQHSGTEEDLKVSLEIIGRAVLLGMLACLTRAHALCIRKCDATGH